MKQKQEGKVNKTGQACLALMCAFFVGSIASTVLALNTDGDGITLDQYEQLFDVDLTNPDHAIMDYDGDGLSNLAEWYNGTDPCKSDTDEDGWPDGIDNEISRARLDFHPLFTDGDCLRYVWPSWMVAAFKAGGAWDTSLPAWYVPAGTSGKLCLILDRSVLTNDVIMELEFYDAPNASLFVDLVNGNKEVLISSELLGNLVDGSGEIVRKAMNISLESYPEAVGIHLRATGELFMFEGLLFVDQDNDGLDANQETALGTSDLMLDSDNDGIADFYEVFVYGTNPAVPDPASGGDKDVQDTATRPTGPPLNPAGSGTRPPAFQATRIKAITIPQLVMTWMSGANFIMSRDTLSGGGTRQTSPAFIMEDSLGQSSSIGFSYGSNITLHAGYQQAEAERLELWNVSVTPPPYQAQIRRFNPTLGETSIFSYVLSTPAKAVTVGVYDPNVLLIRTLVAQQPQNGGLHTVAWDGRDSANNFVPNRKYTFSLSATSYEGAITNYQTVNPNEIRMDVADDIPVIKSVSDQPDPFFPDIVVTSTISYVTTAPAGVNNMNLLIEIRADSLSGSLVRDWSTNQPIGPNSVVWNGTDNNGTPLPDGLYTYAINHAAVPANRANRQTGAIMLLRTNTQAVTSADLQVEVRYSGPATVSITSASPVEVSDALFAIKTADPGQMLESMIYRIEAAPSTNFVPPALMAFKYDQAISGDIEQKLQIRRYNAANRVWEIVPIQFIDYVNHQVLAEITSLSLYALLWGEDTTPPVIQIISPEAREYYQNAAIDIIYEVEDPVVGGVSSGVTEIFVYLNGALYPYASIPPAAFMLGANVLTVVAFDGAGNIGLATVSFTIILEAQVTLKPEALNVNPGILTAFVRLPEGYPVRNITSAACDGALYERMMLSTAGGSAYGGNDDATEMIIKFRRRDIEAALAQIGESIDIYFIVRGAWQDEAGNSYVFQGTDSITKIVGAK